MLPSNEGRGYVLRKIIRRAITHGRLLGHDKLFLHKMVFAVRDLMQDAYPELKERAEQVSKLVLSEEKRFSHTLDLGLEKLEALLNRAKEGWALSGTKDETLAGFDKSIGGTGTTNVVADLRARDKTLPGEEAFKLYDTFGMPLDFIAGRGSRPRHRF